MVDRPTANPPALQLRTSGDELKPEEVESPTLPLPPPRDRAELDRLLIAVACTPDEQRDLIRETIAQFDDRSGVADLLHQALFELPVTDSTRHLMILAVCGELAHDSSAEALERFAWLEDLEVHGHEATAGSDRGSVWFPGGALQARSAEMLVWVTAGRYLAGIRRILREHPLLAVRVATVDALSFARNDSSEVLAELRQMVRDEDRWAIGLPRRGSPGETSGFDEAMERHAADFAIRVVLPEVIREVNAQAGSSDTGGKNVH